MRYFSLVLLLAILILTSIKGYAEGLKRGYCIQVASSYLSQPLVRKAQLIDCKNGINSVRVEKIGKFYVLRVGLWGSKEEAQRVYSQLKRYFKDAILRTCVFKPERVVFSKCSIAKAEKAEEEEKSESAEPKVAQKAEEVENSKPVEAEEPQDNNFVEYVLTLKDIGYPRDLILTGHTFSYTFYIPVLPGFEAGVFNAKLKLSPTVPKNGRITVFINDVPYKTYKISEIGLLSTLKIPVFKDKWSSFCRVKLSFNFLPEGGICKALNVKDIYATVYNSSTMFFRVRADYRPSDILSYLLSYDGELWIEGRDFYKLAEAGYYLAVLYRRFSLYNLKFTQGQSSRKIVISKESSLKGEVLQLNPDDLQAAKFVWPLKTKAFSAASYVKELPTGQFIPLRFFGFKTATAKGVGDVSISFKLPFSGLRGRPKKLLLLLKYAVQDINPEVGDRLWCSLMVNGKLVWSRELLGSPFMQENLIEVPGDALEFGDNRFNVIFSYYPGTGTCEGTVPSIRVTLYDTSAVSLFPLTTDFMTVKDFLKAFGGDVGLVVDGDFSKKFVLELFKLIGYYSPYANKLIPFNPEKRYDFVLVVKPFPKTTASSIPVHYDRGIKIVNPLTGKVALEVNGRYNFLLFQIGSYSNTPALYISPSTKEAEKLVEALAYSDFDRFLGNSVFVFKDALYPFQIGKKFRVEYSKKTAVVYYYKKYKFLIFVAFFVILTLFLVYLWRRLA